MARKKTKRRWLLRLTALVVLLALIAGGYGWWQLQSWTPDEAIFPDQGAHLRFNDAPTNFTTLHALGADFVYVDSSAGDQKSNPQFSQAIQDASAAGMQVGAVHIYDPCLLADPQSANFVTMVPRDDSLLPPVIGLSLLADDCPKRVPDAAIESELMTLINQIERHAGKHAILKITPEFEQRYKVAAKLQRNLWLNNTVFEPEYAGRPWLMWTANEALRSDASDSPIAWVVVRP